MQATNNNAKDESDDMVAKSSTSILKPIDNNFIFGGFEHMCKKNLEVEDQLFVEVQAQAGNDYNKLKNFF